MKNYSVFLHRFVTGANAQLALLVAIIFLVPIFNPITQIFSYKICFTALLIVSSYSLQAKRKGLIILLAVGIIALEWIAAQLNRDVITEILQVAKVVYFVIITGGLIRQTATAKRVNEQVIVDSMSGYLLLGMVFSIGTMMIVQWFPGAYNFSPGSETAEPRNMNDFIYYSFITFTTTGYGDLLPLLPVAKSFSIFMAASGQLYIATIISLLVGKFAASAMNKE